MFRVRVVSVVGVGYVGLVLAACFASKGIRTYVTDKDPGRLGLVKAGKASFYEPRLNGLLRRGLKAGSLHVADGTREAVRMSQSQLPMKPAPPVMRIFLSVRLLVWDAVLAASLEIISSIMMPSSTSQLSSLTHITVILGEKGCYSLG